MPKAPIQTRYNNLLVPFGISEIIKDDSEFISKFTSVAHPTFKIYPKTLFNKDVTWVDGFLELYNTTPIKRCLAVYCPNDIIFKPVMVNKNHSFPQIWVEVGVQIQAVHLQEKAREECLLICEDIKYTLVEAGKNLSKIITNPYTGVTENFQVEYIDIVDFTPLQMDSFNNNFWTCITLMQFQVSTI